MEEGVGQTADGKSRMGKSALKEKGKRE